MTDLPPPEGQAADRPAEASAERGGRWFALAGALWTTAFVTGFLWEMSAAIAGRDGFVRRFEVGGRVRVGLQLAIVAVAALTWVALALRLRADAPSVRGLRRLQWTAGALGLVFAAAYAWRVWVPAASGADAGTIYEWLRRGSSTYGHVAFVSVGLAALALAWEQSLLVFAGTWQFVRRPQTLRWYRLMTIVLPILVFVVGVNAAGHFVVGRGLFWRPDRGAATNEEAAPAAGADAEARPSEGDAPGAATDAGEAP